MVQKVERKKKDLILVYLSAASDFGILIHMELILNLETLNNVVSFQSDSFIYKHSFSLVSLTNTACGQSFYLC